MDLFSQINIVEEEAKKRREESADLDIVNKDIEDDYIPLNEEPIVSSNPIRKIDDTLSLVSINNLDKIPIGLGVKRRVNTAQDATNFLDDVLYGGRIKRLSSHKMADQKRKGPTRVFVPQSSPKEKHKKIKKL